MKWRKSFLVSNLFATVIALHLCLLVTYTPAAILIPPTDTNLLNGLSPLNWVRNPAYVCTPMGGASLKIGFTGTRQVKLNVGTKHIIDLYCKGFSPFENPWLGDIPENSVKITGFTVDSGGATVALPLPAKVWMNIGNCIEQSR